MMFPVQIPKYHTKDSAVMLLSMLPMALLVNYFVFKENYIQNTGNFLIATGITFVYMASAFFTYGIVAISLRNRFPRDRDTYKRLAICLSIFFLLSAVYMSILLLAYDYFNFLGYRYYDRDFINVYLALVTVNVFLTFLNEGLYRFEKFKATATETEQLKKEYMHSQLLGLKSQMNPHFLFNSLNTLSSLIHEDAEQAEDFLDHMSKVYRYLLRNNEEQLVTLGTELGFIRSYYFLLRSRHKEGLQLLIDIPGEFHHDMIPPLTLQMILENSLTHNAVSRSAPLRVTISVKNGWIEIRHNLQRKFMNTEENKEVIENIRNKFRLLCQQEIKTVEKENERIISLPLVPDQEHKTA